MSQDQLPFQEPRTFQEPQEPQAPAAATPAPTDAPPTPELFAVQVARSTRRRRTVGAQMKDGVLHITLPSWMSKAEEAHWRQEMTARFRRRLTAERIDLRERSSTLARRYDLPRPKEIRWADDMTTRWGSCTPANGTIRLSSRLAGFPSWVLDYVIVHELAHLAEHGHGPEFWRLVRQYPRAERAIGYLIAKSTGPTDPDDDGSIADGVD